MHPWNILTQLYIMCKYEYTVWALNLTHYREREALSLTSVTVIEVGKLVPLVVLNQAEGSFEVWSHLNDKWMELPSVGKLGVMKDTWSVPQNDVMVFTDDFLS